MSSVANTGRADAHQAWLWSTAAWERVLPWLAGALALAARLFHVSANGLRTDEMYSVWMASRGLPELLRAIVLEGHDATPPTYYVLLHGMLQVSWELWAIRLVSVVAGTALVILAYRLARHLFDLPVAAASALLLALTPFSIEVSQVARAYAVTAMLALASLYLFARLRTPHTPVRRAWGYALVTLLALSTHYLFGIVVVVQNLIVLALAIIGHLPRRKLLGWIKLQFVMGLVALPLVWMAIQRVPQERGSTSGQGWLAAPSVSGLVKALILWATGDPSYGPTGLTVARVASLAVVVALLGLGAVTAWRLWRTHPEQRVEVRNIALVAVAFFGIWGLALGVSLARKIFHEKYFIYLAPLLLILLVWSALRIRPVLLGRGLLAALVGLTGVALYIFYRSPNGEQWREAMAYVRAEQQTGDYVVTTPGFYIRPLGYYLTGELPSAEYTLARAPFALVAPNGYVAADYSGDQRGLPDVDTALAPAERVWLVTGYNPLEPDRLAWFYEDYVVLSEREFLGVDVILGERHDLEPSAASPRTPVRAGRTLNALRAAR